MFDATDIQLLIESLDQHAQRVHQELFASEAEASPDGALDAIPDLLAELSSMELLADPNGMQSAEDYSVWGRHTLDQGCALSLAALATLARGCAGLAGAVHAQGIGCLALDGKGSELPGVSTQTGTPSSIAAAIVVPYGVLLDPRTAHEGLRVGQGSDGRLEGSSPFVTAASEPQQLVVLARCAPEPDCTDSDQWVVISLDTATLGVRLTDTGPRVGLRAMAQYSVTFDEVDLSDSTTVAQGPAATTLVRRVCACDWLGYAAIALGTARQAVLEARSHALQRHQGGRIIADHAAVQLLLTEADHDLEMLDAVLSSRSTLSLRTISDDDLLRWAVSSRLAIGEHARRAVNNAMQVLGGYGYLDDYGISKRVRDVSALGARHGSRAHLLMLAGGVTADCRRSEGM